MSRSDAVAMVEAPSLEQPSATSGGSSLDSLSNEELQRVLAGAVRTYAARLEAGERFPPFAADGGVTATEVMIAGTAMLKAVNLQLFELGMWQASTGNF